MASNTGSTFDDRRKASLASRQAMLERFKTRPAVEDPDFQAKQAELKAFAEARDTRIAERKAARAAELAAAEAARKAAEEEAAAAAKAAAAELKAQQKAARDAAYAARKARKKR
jgi:peptidoglycan hydrolase CwlO-like protein